ncbi:MAG: biopolymer transporter ExbD [Opitutales bacterium]|nr:biopolymer transporter ExbD [Opitutales bacterium]
MARTFKRKESLGALTELNITPLMDLAFSLLIIFMVTTPLLEQTVELKLPTQEKMPNSMRDDKVKFQVINIDAKENIYWGDEKVSLEQLNIYLRKLSLEPEPSPITLRGDGKLPYQKVMDVISAIKKHNLKKLNLDTEVK